jgi:hypothetical protein
VRGALSELDRDMAVWNEPAHPRKPLPSKLGKQLLPSLSEDQALPDPGPMHEPDPVERTTSKKQKRPVLAMKGEKKSL